MLSSHNYWMQQAINYCTLSKDHPSVQNAALIISREGDVVSREVNGLTEGVEDTPEKWERPAKYMWVEHAERNAVYNYDEPAPYSGFEHGMSYPLHGATMYSPWAACHSCARAIVQSGIVTLVRFPMPEADGWQESI